MHRKGFTLLELLIVIAILAVLATITVLVINPLEYIKQSRDVKRISDMESLNKAIGLVAFEGISLSGPSTTVFASLVNATPDCIGLSLPPLPAGYQYHCVTTATDINKVDGTGWVPVNFNNLSSKSPLSILPVDPINNATNFYTYIPGGSFALSATLESDKYLKQSALNDGGTNPAKIEMGSDISLLTKADGLVGYWALDEAIGTVANDTSGHGIIGTIAGTPDWTSGKVGGALNFDGVTNAITIANPITQTNATQEWTIIAWAKIKTKSSQTLLNLNNGVHLVYTSTNKLILYLNGGVNDYYNYGNRNLQDDTWHQVAFVFKNSTGLKEIYVDGVTVSMPGPNMTSIPSGIPGTLTIGSGVFGLLDDLRIYTRQLSAQEIRSAYSATK